MASTSSSDVQTERHERHLRWMAMGTLQSPWLLLDWQDARVQFNQDGGGTNKTWDKGLCAIVEWDLIFQWITSWWHHRTYFRVAFFFFFFFLNVIE